MPVVTERGHNVLLCNPPADQAAGGRDLHCADGNKKSYRSANKRIFPLVVVVAAVAKAYTTVVVV